MPRTRPGPKYLDARPVLVFGHGFDAIDIGCASRQNPTKLVSTGQTLTSGDYLVESDDHIVPRDAVA